MVVLTGCIRSTYYVGLGTESILPSTISCSVVSVPSVPLFVTAVCIAQREKDASYTLPPEMFGAFGSVWCKIALAEVGLSLP